MVSLSFYGGVGEIEAPKPITMLCEGTNMVGSDFSTETEVREKMHVQRAAPVPPFSNDFCDPNVGSLGQNLPRNGVNFDVVGKKSFGECIGHFERRAISAIRCDNNVNVVGYVSAVKKKLNQSSH